MKKITLLILSLTFLSCSLPKYKFKNQTQTTGLDFRSGKWLLNEINAPYNVRAKLNKLIITDFGSFLNNRLIQISNTKGVIVPQSMNLNPSLENLKNLKIGTSNYDFFINIKAVVEKNEFGNIDITPQRFKKNKSKNASITIEIYDLNNLQIVYSQTATGSVTLPQKNGDIHITNSVNSIIIGGYKRLINDIN